MVADDECSGRSLVTSGWKSSVELIDGCSLVTSGVWACVDTRVACSVGILCVLVGRSVDIAVDLVVGRDADTVKALQMMQLHFII